MEYFGQARNASGPETKSFRCHSMEHEFRGRKSPSKTLTNSEPPLDAQVAKHSKTAIRAEAHSDRCRVRVEECLRITAQGAERLDRRSEVINEALAEEIQRGEQRKMRSDKSAGAIPELEPAVRESPIEPDPNPKRRLLRKSASSAASGSGQQGAKRPATDTESPVGNGHW